jgi:hypothetical protein
MQAAAVAAEMVTMEVEMVAEEVGQSRLHTEVVMVEDLLQQDLEDYLAHLAQLIEVAVVELLAQAELLLEVRVL